MSPSPRSVAVVFGYAFPHKKTQDVILRLCASGRRPKAVVAAPWVPLPHAAPPQRTKVRHADLLEPAELCRGLGIEYFAAEHAGDTCLLYLDELHPDVGVVAGARILPHAVLERFPRGVLNLHPGLLPEARGLDALLWAVYRDAPLGVTAHLIDQRVDAGWVVERRPVAEYPDDTLPELNLRLYETQLLMLPSALEAVLAADRSMLPRVTGGQLAGAFPAALLGELHARFDARRARLRGRRSA